MTPEHIESGQLCGIALETPVHGKMVEVNTVAKIVYGICVGTTGFRVSQQFTDIDPASKIAINKYALGVRYAFRKCSLGHWLSHCKQRFNQSLVMRDQARIVRIVRMQT